MRGRSKHEDAGGAEVLLASFRPLRGPSGRSTTNLDEAIKRSTREIRGGSQ
jgi:hypothetical protein